MNFVVMKAGCADFNLFQLALRRYVLAVLPAVLWSSHRAFTEMVVLDQSQGGPVWLLLWS
jgi:hypothetical protein